VLRRPVVNGGFIVGTIIKPKLGLRPFHRISDQRNGFFQGRK
jgi:hypothetical protein